ncbi:hypothetical protein [Diplocloster agilis]|uniref:hypothetical protein n=1 Tax=Diplocloster agilis TaxID=2850323 RepID=UPI000820C31D|nr:hypothetical protein [Suonthocola fibrivorans]MCU6736749.1 hypothetical protein [Suonthocola fibrivorans]SCJ93351.1 Uncharacterised protein [uncultured Clostridium sp.]
MKKTALLYLMSLVFCLTACGTVNNSAVQKSSNTELEINGDVSDDTAYIGEYLDSDAQEPNLEIAKGNGGTYIVQIGIYRLTTLEDGIGELTAEGMHFTATDAAGHPISGLIISDGQTATVTFTDSTWENLPNDSAFRYTKASDTPNLWNQ